MHSSNSITDLTQAIREKFRPERIILFGSHPRGEAGPDSDVDLLVVMPLKDKTARQQAAEILRACHQGFPLDIIVRTPKEFADGVKSRNWFLREIAREGKVLYAA